MIFPLIMMKMESMIRTFGKLSLILICQLKKMALNHKFIFASSVKQEENVFMRREGEKKQFPIEFNKIQQEVR